MIKSIQQHMKQRTDEFIAFLKWLNQYHSVVLWMSAIMYHFSLTLLYIFAVSPSYSYAGLTLAPNAIKYILSWASYLLIFYTMPKGENKIGAFCLNLQFVVTVAPLLVYYALNDQSTLYIAMIVIAMLLQNWILRNSGEERISIHIIGLRPYVDVFVPFFIISCLFIAGIWNGFYGFQAFDLDLLYVMRKNASYPPMLSYFLSWITSVLLPFFLAYSLYAKRYIWSSMYIFVELALYMIMGNKFIYLSLVIIIGIFVIASLKLPLKLLYIGFILLNLVMVVLYLLERGNPDRRIAQLLTSFIGIRFLFIPAQNKFLYYECFSELPKVFFADGQIGKFFGLTNPYVGSLGQTIFAFDGGEMFASNSNTGYLGDSYAQFGFLGVIVTAILLALILKYFDNCTPKSMKTVFLIAMGVQMIILNDGAFLTTLLTGGMVILIVFAAVYSDPHNITKFGNMNRAKGSNSDR